MAHFLKAHLPGFADQRAAPGAGAGDGFFIGLCLAFFLSALIVVTLAVR